MVLIIYFILGAVAVNNFSSIFNAIMKIGLNLHSHDQVNYELCKKSLGNRVKKICCKENYKQKACRSMSSAKL